MMRDILKQMLPFFLLLFILWLAAELLENSFSDRNILAPPISTPISSPETE